MRLSALNSRIFPFFLFRTMTYSPERTSNNEVATQNLWNAASVSKLPPILTSPPVSALVKPGNCQFGPEKVKVPLLERTQVSKNAKLLRFGLPDSSKPLNLSTCSCILAAANCKGEDVVRPYTPISTNQLVGSFYLLVKDYGPDSKMSYHICDEIKIGDCVEFKHIDKNDKIQAPFDYDHVIMLSGGAGITPFIQALNAILGDKSPDRRCKKATLLYGSQVSDDIMGKSLLQKWADEHPEELEYVDILSNEPEDSGWKGPRGMMDKAFLEAHIPKPDCGKKIIIFVCGPPPMYKALCGPRDDSEVTGLLGEMGYKSEQVYKF
jgi:cytochrome-b5 reductase